METFQLLQGDNLLKGWLPSKVGLLLMQRLRVHNNQLSGPIPTKLGLVDSLGYAHLDGNLWTGPIPTELGNLQDLIELDLSNAQSLTGTLPVQVANLAMHYNLRLLVVGGTNLTSTIPESLSVLDNGKDCSYLLSNLDSLFDPLGTNKICLLGFDCSGQLCRCSLCDF